ncbi:MAG: dockerin type I repeat-containing protein, partial [Clostridia bacterium]|nr:dockerin type I repeat-containing protein [Clostridia bacterium]
VNGDGVVDNKDIVRLKKYLANLDEATGVSTAGTTVFEIFPGADANDDGVVNNKDIVRLKNYFANYDEETGISSNGNKVYTLGPAVA